jgi:hypothetical protein
MERSDGRISLEDGLLKKIKKKLPLRRLLRIFRYNKKIKVMKIETKFKYAAVTPDNQFPLHFSEKEIYVHEKLAKKNLEYWIRSYELNLAEYERLVEVLPQHIDEWLPRVEEYKAGLEVLNSCRIVKIEISFEVVG